MNRIITFTRRALVGSSTLLLVSAVVAAENIDPLDDGSQYVWTENIGWLNAELDTDGDGTPDQGISVGDAQLTGWLWGENIGWVSLSCETTSSCGTVDFGVTNDGLGVLSGYAWAENAGWISFSCQNTASCGTVSYGVTIDPFTGEFDGYAWGENIGWIKFASRGTNPFVVVTAWRCPDLDADIVCRSADNCPNHPNPRQSNVDADGYGDLCDLCPADATDTCDPDGSVAENVSAARGGSLITPDGGMSVSIPPGALAGDTTVSVTERVFDDPAADLALSTGTGLGMRVSVYDLEPDGTEFSLPVTITMVADVTALNENQRENLNLYLENDVGDFELIPSSSCTIVADTATCTADITHFSVYALIAPLDSDNDGIPDRFDGIVDICPSDPNVIDGLLPPLVGLVPLGDEVLLPDKAFKSNRTLPLKLNYLCDTVPVTDQDDVTPPELLEIWRVGDAEALPVIDPDQGEEEDSGAYFRYSDEHWIYNFSTTAFGPGTYEAHVKLPDGRTFASGFVLR